MAGKGRTNDHRRAPPRSGRPGEQGRLTGFLASHREALGESTRGLLATPFSSAMTILVIAVALLLPGLTGLLAGNLAELGDNLRSSAGVTAYLAAGVSNEDALRLSSELRGRAGIAGVDYTSRGDALAEFRTNSGFAGVIAALDDNPLPASLSITPESASEADIQTLAGYLENLDQVESVSADLGWIQRLSAMQALVARLGRLLTLVLGLAVLFIVGNTIRTGIENRQREIDVLKLVGGTAGYIARPFLYSGLLLGLCGALLASLLIMVIQLAINEPIDNLLSLYGSALQIRVYTLEDVLGLVLLGGLLGWLGAAVSTAVRLYSSPP